MNEEQAKKKIGEDLLPKLFERGLQGVDRTPTVRLPFDDVEEYYCNTFKKFPLPQFSTLDKLLFKIVTIYFEAQMRPLCEDPDIRKRIVFDLTKDCEIELLETFKKKWPILCKNIEADRNSSPLKGFFKVKV